MGPVVAIWVIGLGTTHTFTLHTFTLLTRPGGPESRTGSSCVRLLDQLSAGWSKQLTAPCGHTVWDLVHLAASSACAQVTDTEKLTAAHWSKLQELGYVGGYRAVLVTDVAT